MVLRLFSLFAMAAGMLALAEPAAAAWHKAESDHFVIYADDSERDIVVFAQNLERYHRAMELITTREVAPPSPSSRVVIFVVGNQRDLRQVLDTNSRTIAGMYVPRAGASRAFVQDIRNSSSGYPEFSTIVLMHEYAHHFLWSSSRFAMPRWLSEGAAEFFASAMFKRDGSLAIGLPARHRGGELYNATPVSVRELLDPEMYRANRGRAYDAFYGRSWLLYHYLSFNPERSGQLNAYWQAVGAGESSVEAGTRIFGDLDELDDELDDYLKNRRMLSYTIDAQHLPVKPIAITRISDGEAKMMPVRMASQRGVNRERALELVEDARKIAAEYPDDPGVLTALAEAEYDAGNDAAAIDAADAALAADPSRVNAYVQKGYALFRMAQDADDPEAAYKAAMAPLEALNRMENDHPIPLIYYYRSFVAQGREPNENARTALEYAAQLAPFDQGLWLQVGLMQAGEGKIGLARQSLRPLASNPHGGRLAQSAQRFIAMLSDRPEGAPVRNLTLAVEQPDINDDEGSDGEDGESGAD